MFDRFSSEKKETLYPVHQDKHKIKIYRNAYDDISYSSGLFVDMQNAIKKAKEFICISSWSISLTANLKMEKNLGELLVEAAKRGVKVYILVWDSYRSEKQKVININKDFLESFNSRNIFYKRATRTKQFFYKKFLSHHQKILITENTAFINGIDLVPYVVDSKEHLGSQDYIWQDAGSQVQGKVILDIFEMFQARWCSQPEAYMICNSDALAINYLKEHCTHLKKTEFLKLEKEDKEKKDDSVQFLVSLTKADYSSTRFWPFKTDYTNEIHTEILKSIKKSKNYIFIINQYFIGHYIGQESSPNKIPQALIDRIAEAYSAKEPFHVYCTFPAVPGKAGTLEAASLLRMQWETTQYVIHEINKKTNGHASDYITFMELIVTDVALSAYRQVYVHSKILLTPTEIFVGSANFNERSLAGNRDSESMMKIIGYDTERHEFLVGILEEFYGYNIFQKLKEYEVLKSLGSPEIRAIIQSSIDSRFLSLSPKARLTIEKFPRDSEQKVSHLLGCAYPWGLISRKNLMQGEKPSYVSDQAPAPLALINKLGGGIYTR